MAHVLWYASCRDDEDYDTNTIDVRPKKGYESVQIVFEAFLDRSNGQMGYDMWFDKFYHGYGRCSAMRCGPFPPPLLKGGGAAFGHDVGGLTCTKEDAVGSMCKMECPSTHPGTKQQLFTGKRSHGTTERCVYHRTDIDWNSL